MKRIYQGWNFVEIMENKRQREKIEKFYANLKKSSNKNKEKNNEIKNNEIDY